MEWIKIGQLDILRQSLRGLKRGQMEASVITSTVKCAVICTKFPSFLLNSTFMRRFDPGVIICYPVLLPLVQCLVTDTTIIYPLDVYDTPIINNIVRQIKLAFAHGGFNATISNWLLGNGITKVISSTNPGQLHKEWRRSSILI